jgi:hypothetical protein
MSQSHRNSEHWYSCRQRMVMVYVRWSAWTSDIFQRFSSNWSMWSCSHDPTSGNIQRSVFVPFSDLYFLQNLWDWWVFAIYAISCTVQIITAKNHILESYTVCLTTLTAPSFVHTMGDYQNISQTVVDSSSDDDNLYWICSTVAISVNSWNEIFLWYCWECVFI